MSSLRKSSIETLEVNSSVYAMPYRKTKCAAKWDFASEI